MLTQLKAFDSDLREGLAELAKHMSQPALNGDLLSRTRLKLTRLIGRRRSLIQCTILPCLHDVPPKYAAQLGELRVETVALAVQFSTHLVRWTARAIQADWAGYQTASVEMRRSLLRRIDADTALLYPLLTAKMGLALS